ncbi:MAG: hypothetical protein GY747_06495 [Planctomycetes bacterium]|nr:hypothetical protein [Planctomycetota bacterium]MCP4771421.1 hypothetical protein [Planctomycetota bacterium]MCP4861858.1 hypothetical protein [Planctomycetota bacterium]
MELTTERPLQLGHLVLDLGESGSQHARDSGEDSVVPLADAEELIPRWVQSGALLAAQAMAPAAALPKSTRQRMSFLGMGPGIALAAYIAVCLEAAFVEVVLHPTEVEVFDRLVARRQSPTEVRKLKRVDDAVDGAFHHMVAMGCDGQVPESLTSAAPLVKRMRPEGQLCLYGLPASKINDVFDRTAKKGLALRAMGVRGDLAFLSGSLERQNQFG